MRCMNPTAAAVIKQLNTDQRGHAATLNMELGQGDTATKQTIAAMRAIVHDAAGSPLVHQAASTIAAKAPNRDKWAQLLGLDAFLRECVHFKPDTLGREVLRHPAQLLREIAANGVASCDCDDVAMLGASIVRVLGMRPAFITVGGSPDAGYSHVHYAALWPMPTTRLIPFDPQERIQPGTWTPAARRAGWWA